MINICKMPVFNYNIWITAAARKDVGNITLLQLFLIMEMMVNVFLLTGSILLAVLFFNRRDTFPFTLATYYFACTVFIYADNAINNYFFHTHLPDSIISMNSVLWPLLRMAIWIPYLLASERGKTTFVMPYRGRERV